jgi:drug/metabolite transporter (DMT)-like permease
MDAVKRAPIVAAFSTICIVWGSTFLAIRFAIETIPPLLMASIRFLAAGSALYLWLRRSTPPPTLVNWRSAAVIGVALLAFSNGAVTWAEEHIASGVAALFVATIPLWMVLLEWLRHKSGRPRGAVIAGLILGFGGVFLLIGLDPASGQVQMHPAAVIVLMLGPVSWALGSLYVRNAKLPESQFLAAAMEMLCGGVGLLVLATITGEWKDFHPAAISLRSLTAVAYLSVFGSIIAFSAYVWLLRTISAARVSTYAYINPVIALVVGWAFGGETLTLRILIAAAVIIIGVVLIITSKAKSRTATVKVSRLPQTNIEAERSLKSA